MSYSIEILENELENEESSLVNCTTKQMTRIYLENIDDLKLAIHNLKQLKF